MNLSKSIKVLCAQREVMQKDLAQSLGITNPYLSKIMSENKTSTARLQQFADFFGVPVSEFLKAGE